MEKQKSYELKKSKINITKNISLNILLKIIIFLCIFEKYKTISSFIYPKAIQLINENIFIIHKDGIDIYDSSLSKIIKSIIIFREDDKIKSHEIYNKITIAKYNESNFEYIFTIINNKIYIFNSDGGIVYNTDNKMSILNGDNYSLIPIKKIDNKFYYMIGFINKNNYIQLLLFEYDNKTHKNELSYNNNAFNYTVINKKSFLIKNNLLTCQLIKKSSKNDVIVCFYFINSFNKVLTNSFIIRDNSTINIENTNNKINLPNDANEIKIINSLINYDNSKIFIYFLDSFEKEYIFTYFVNSNSFSEYIELMQNCKFTYSGIQFNYVRDTEQYLLSCVNDKKYINLVIFNKNFEYLSKYNINNVEYKLGYSIVYSLNRNIYIIISDKSQELNNFYQILNEKQWNFNKFESFKEIKMRKMQEIINCGNLEKCKTCDSESISKKLCLKCNNENNYYQINPSYIDQDNPTTDKYIDCFNNITKPSNFYLNNNTGYYEPCYLSCATCDFGGDGNQNNCTSCAMDYMFEPIENTTNCVASCKNFYYYTSYGQYKCSSNPQCPEENNLLIRVRKKCIDSCLKDKDFKYQYNGECLSKCPNDTKSDENYICKIMKYELCSQSTTQFDLYDFLKEGGVEKIAKTYAKEFSYTNKHISLFKNDVYSIMLYKSSDCITELKLSMPEINFGSCYFKVKENYKIEGSLLVAIIDKISSKKSNPITSYSFYNPNTGEKLDSETACKEQIIEVKENIKSLLNDTVQDMNSILFLTEQNIDVFNKTSGFYTDICYHYESPCDKDVALRDRLLIYYPNITLCDYGCSNAGVNLTSMTAICQCKYKEMTDEEGLEETNLYQSAVNEVFNILNQINIAVMACYQDLFTYKYFIACTGGLIILFLILIQIVSCIVYYSMSFFLMKKYIFNITENYLLYLNKSPMYKPHFNKLNEEEKKSQKENCPPKKNQHTGDININIFKIHNNKKQIFKIKGEEAKKNIIKTIEGSEDKNNSKIVLCNKKLFQKKKRTKSNSNITNIKLEKSSISLKSNEKSNSLTNTSNANKELTFFDTYLTTHLNDMLFNDALIKDNRLFFDYFWDKLKKKQTILELFLIDNPIKPKTLKILLLIIDIEVCFVINGMFINEEYVSKLFHSTKEEKFMSFLSRSINRIIYTIISSILVSYIVGCFFVEEKRLKSIFKYEKNNPNLIKYDISLVIREIKWRYNLFILLTFIGSIFSWYYISCFNNIYPHMKIEWIKSNVFIILLVHLISVIVTLIETLLRFVSFEIKSEKIYKASLWLA